MSQHYSDPTRESDPHALPDIEVFELTAAEAVEQTCDEDTLFDYQKRYPLASMNSRDRERMIDAIIAEEGITGGWFWQACFPGCLPDGPPMGPFATRAEALTDAQSGALEFHAEECQNPAGCGVCHVCQESHATSDHRAQ